MENDWILIDQGAYVYARNNERKSDIDYLTDFCDSNKSSKEVQSALEMLKTKVPPLQTLAATKAKALHSVSDIPKSTVKFLEMHWITWYTNMVSWT